MKSVLWIITSQIFIGILPKKEQIGELLQHEWCLFPVGWLIPIFPWECLNLREIMGKNPEFLRSSRVVQLESRSGHVKLVGISEPRTVAAYGCFRK